MGYKKRYKYQHLQIGKPETRLPGLQYDGEKLYCGICGKGFQILALHIMRKHGLTTDDYKEEFSLNRTQPLCTPEYSLKLSKHLIKQVEIGQLARPGWTNTPLRGSFSGMKFRHQTAVMRDANILKERQTENGAKAHKKVPCATCGKPTNGTDSNEWKYYCPECWKSHRKEYLHEWYKKRTFVLKSKQ